MMYITFLHKTVLRCITIMHHMSLICALLIGRLLGYYDTIDLDFTNDYFVLYEQGDMDI